MVVNKDSEKYLERKLCEGIKDLGGIAYKFVSPNQRGVPDRICFIPGRQSAIFVELKSKGKKPSPLQEIEIKKLRDIGQAVVVIDNYRDLMEYLFDWDPRPF